MLLPSSSTSLTRGCTGRSLRGKEGHEGGHLFQAVLVGNTALPSWWAAPSSDLSEEPARGSRSSVFSSYINKLETPEQQSFPVPDSFIMQMIRQGPAPLMCLWGKTHLKAAASQEISHLWPPDWHCPSTPPHQHSQTVGPGSPAIILSLLLLIKQNSSASCRPANGPGTNQPNTLLLIIPNIELHGSTTLNLCWLLLIAICCDQWKLGRTTDLN